MRRCVNQQSGNRPEWADGASTRSRFPTGGIIYGTSKIRQAYETGRGIIHVRGKARSKQSKIATASLSTSSLSGEQGPPR